VEEEETEGVVSIVEADVVYDLFFRVGVDAESFPGFRKGIVGFGDFVFRVLEREVCGYEVWSFWLPGGARLQGFVEIVPRGMISCSAGMGTRWGRRAVVGGACFLRFWSFG